MLINKKIHYCWFGGKEMPPLCIRCIESWDALLPDYEIKRWDESNIPKDIPFVNDMLEKKKYAFVSDYIRLYALFMEGGIYLDTDIEVVKSFDDLLDNAVFLGEEAKGRPNAGVIGSIKGHSYLLDCMNLIITRHEQNKHYLIAPEVAQKVLENNYQDVLLLSSSAFYPYNPYDLSKKVNVFMYSDVTENTYAVHHWNHGWKISFGERLIRAVKKILKTK